MPRFPVAPASCLVRPAAKDGESKDAVHLSRVPAITGGLGRPITLAAAKLSPIHLHKTRRPAATIPYARPRPPAPGSV